MPGDQSFLFPRAFSAANKPSDNSIHEGSTVSACGKRHMYGAVDGESSTELINVFLFSKFEHTATDKRRCGLPLWDAFVCGSFAASYKSKPCIHIFCLTRGRRIGTNHASFNPWE